MIRSRLLPALTVLVIMTAIANGQPAVTTPEATAHEASGNKHYELAEYPAAIIDFKEAFRITDQPELLFNIAQAYRLAGDCRQALTFYKTFLRRSPQAPNADKVAVRIREMEECTAKLPPPVSESKPVVVPAPPRRHIRTWKTWAGISAIGAGAVGSGIGIAFAARGATKADELRDACSTSCSGEVARELDATGTRANRNAVVAFSVAGALVVGGVVFVVLDRGSSERAPTSTGPSLSLVPGSATVAWAWRF